MSRRSRKFNLALDGVWNIVKWCSYANRYRNFLMKICNFEFSKNSKLSRCDENVNQTVSRCFSGISNACCDLLFAFKRSYLDNLCSF